MKRIALLLMAMILAFLTGCTAMTDEDADKTLDADRSFVHKGGIWGCICDTEDTLYFTGATGRLLHYADKTTGVSGPLCGKPECDHNDSSCNAYCSDRVWGLSVYDGRLYWVSGSAIYSAALNGTDRREVREIDRALFPVSALDLYMVFHRGYAYLACQKRTVKDGEPVYSNYVCAFPLDPEEEPFVILDEAGTESCSVVFQPYEDWLYIITDESGPGIQEDKEHIQTPYGFTIRRWDTQSRKLETLFYKNEDALLQDPKELWALDDGILFSGYITETEETGIYKLDFERENVELLFTVAPASTGVYARVGIADSFVAGHRLYGNGEWYVILKDFEGNTIIENTFILDLPDEISPFLAFSGADAEQAYFSAAGMLSGDSGDTLCLIIVAVPLDGSEANVLCTETEYLRHGST